MVACRIVSKELHDFVALRGAIDVHVHSIYDRVVNLVTDSGRLITAGDSSCPLMPWGLVADDGFVPCLYAQGAPVRLALCSEGEKGDFLLAGATQMETVLHAHPCANGGKDPAGRLGRFLGGYAPAGAIGETLSWVVEGYPAPTGEGLPRAGAPLFHGLLTALRGGGLQDAPSILGFGAGLTPAADDFLLGLLSLWHFKGRRDEKALKGYTQKRLQSTTQISRQMLANALEDRYPSCLLDFYAAFFSGQGDEEKALLGLLSHGHSSGADMLHGIYTGLCLEEGALRFIAEKGGELE